VGDVRKRTHHKEEEEIYEGIINLDSTFQNDCKQNKNLNRIFVKMI